MYKFLFSFLLSVFLGNVYSADDAISQRTYEYLKRVNEYIDEENFERAQKDLETFERYYSSDQSYERALMQQLYGNFYAIQGMYKEAIEKYENALKFKKMPLITGFQVRKNLSQCYFQISDYKNTTSLIRTISVIKFCFIPIIFYTFVNSKSFFKILGIISGFVTIFLCLDIIFQFIFGYDFFGF